MNRELYCPKDFNRGDYREDHCNVGGIPCPDPKPVDPELVVSVNCGPCGRSWGLPIEKVMRGKAQSFHQCVLAECAAKIEVPAVAPAPLPAGTVLALEGDISTLEARDALLSKLEAAGVDNWEGYPALGEDDEEEASAPTPLDINIAQGESAPAPATTGKTSKPRK